MLVCPAPGNHQIEKKVEHCLKEWVDVVAEGDQQLFAKRLAYDGLNLNTIRPLLGDVEFAGKLPSWTETLNSVLQSSAQLEFDGLHDLFPCIADGDPLPFEEILLPFVLTARKRLHASEHCDHLTDKARAALERFLLTRMSELSSRVLELEFNAFLACLQFAGITYSAASRDKASRKHYLEFVQNMRTGGSLRASQGLSRTGKAVGNAPRPVGSTDRRVCGKTARRPRADQEHASSRTRMLAKSLIWSRASPTPIVRGARSLS